MPPIAPERLFGKKRKSAHLEPDSNGHKSVKLDELSWKSISMPDRMDDVEGFMELEEIDDVAVHFEDVKGGRKAIYMPVKTPNGKKTTEKLTKKNTERNSALRKQKRTIERQVIREERTSGLKVSNCFSSLPKDHTIPLLPNWSSISLHSTLLAALHALAFKTPTSIQKLSIPQIQAGHSLIGKASTGSGKTLAFALPILDSIISSPHKSPAALIIAPTRELAKQIYEHIEEVAKYSAITSICITGGLSIQKQRRILSKNPNIIIATPGRLWEVINDGEGTISQFSNVRFLVLDEADRLLQDGHFKEVEEILNVLKGERQTLIFSATLRKELLGSLSSFKNNPAGKEGTLEYLLQKLDFKETPKFVDANPTESLAKEITEGDLYLYYFLLRYPARSLVFTNSIHSVRRLVSLIQNLNLPAIGLHSQMIQKQRMRSLEKFKERNSSILIATDVAARGLDVSNIQHVIHYHIPRSTDMYIHRSGRTARASELGLSVMLASANEMSSLAKMMGKLDRKLRDVRTFPVDRSIINKIKRRVELAKKLSDETLSQNRQSSKNNFLKEAAEDLGINLKELDPMKKGASKSEIGRYKAELAGLLTVSITPDLSLKYLTSGSVNLGEILSRGEGLVGFLGFKAEDARKVIG
ncbi:ATP-dependent RNA helicase mak5 [Neolecta irregularis DAH-3]|uniref:ATP-dependent RNA helicase mak5 n=1 Tax=Neolecta irregularis (strain DAH-3) TaxID=1198029 RepID=A0A1U7LSK7_NEOID|nr:ATP-dependent RNA helicase mak5 [Neolecta irregularis DAH-3]|eukprot:OLL25598.1 ATP-dependent RNA helicase mak5 [Neolecta irregularis DAH-3]